jgi:hypothetical protein
LLFFCDGQIQLEYIEDPEDFNRRVEQGDLCVTKIDDIERNNYCFTDGSGLISKGLARLVAERLDYLVKSEENVCIFLRGSIFERSFRIFCRRCILLVIKFEWRLAKVL